jgi:hypothetical protein
MFAVSFDSCFMETAIKVFRSDLKFIAIFSLFFKPDAGPSAYVRSHQFSGHAIPNDLEWRVPPCLRLAATISVEKNVRNNALSGT